MPEIHENEISEIRNFVHKTEGWLKDREGVLLYRLARKCTGRGVIVEIGSWKGKSTIWLARGSRSGNRVKVFAIDPHTGSEEHKSAYGKVWTFKEFKENIKNAGVKELVVPIVKTSEKTAESFDKPVELIFIDGAHEYEFVKKDFDLWFPKLINGGIMAFHDTITWRGPRKVVIEKIYRSHNFKNVGLVGQITFGEKILKNCLKDRLKNARVFLLYIVKVILFNIVLKILPNHSWLKKTLKST